MVKWILFFHSLDTIWKYFFDRIEQFVSMIYGKLIKFVMLVDTGETFLGRLYSVIKRNLGYFKIVGTIYSYYSTFFMMHLISLNSLYL